MSQINNPQDGYLSVSVSGQGYILLPNIYPMFESASSQPAAVANTVYGMQVMIPFQITLSKFFVNVPPSYTLNFNGSSTVGNASGGKTVYTRPFGTGIGNNALGGVFTLSAAANASGGNTVYTGSGFSSEQNLTVTIAGFTNSANNGVFKVISSNSTQLTVNNPSGAAETHAGTATVASLTVIASGFTNAANNGTFTVAANGSTTITLNNAGGVSESSSTGNISVVSTVSSHAGFGLYNTSGNLVISGTVTGGALGVVSATVSPVIIKPGTYYFCWTSDTTTSTSVPNGSLYLSGGQTAFPYGTMMPAITTGSYMFTAANVGVSGVLPATLGALTPVAASFPTCVCTP